MEAFKWERMTIDAPKDNVRLKQAVGYQRATILGLRKEIKETKGDIASKQMQRERDVAFKRNVWDDGVAVAFSALLMKNKNIEFIESWSQLMSQFNFLDTYTLGLFVATYGTTSQRREWSDMGFALPEWKRMPTIKGYKGKHNMFARHPFDEQPISKSALRANTQTRASPTKSSRERKIPTTAWPTVRKRNGSVIRRVPTSPETDAEASRVRPSSAIRHPPAAAATPQNERGGSVIRRKIHTPPPIFSRKEDSADSDKDSVVHHSSLISRQDSDDEGGESDGDTGSVIHRVLVSSPKGNRSVYGHGQHGDHSDHGEDSDDREEYELVNDEDGNKGEVDAVEPRTRQEIELGALHKQKRDLDNKISLLKQWKANKVAIQRLEAKLQSLRMEASKEWWEDEAEIALLEMTDLDALETVSALADRFDGEVDQAKLYAFVGIRGTPSQQHDLRIMEL
jgi:hypothetical protein